MEEDLNFTKAAAKLHLAQPSLTRLIHILEEGLGVPVPLSYCFVSVARRCSTMNSLQRHGPEEAYKQLHLRMKRRGLASVKVHVTRRAGKMQFHFTGSDEEVKQAEKILADWN